MGKSNRNLKSHRFLMPSLLAPIILITFIVYFPGLHGPFVFDDTITITQNPAVTDFVFGKAGLREVARQDRPLAIMSFILNRWLAPDNEAFAFKLVNVLIHLLNTGLVFLLVHRLLTAARTEKKLQPPEAGTTLPLLAAALWALHPIQMTSILYVVQRMNSLSATCVLAGLLIFSYGRHREARGKAHGVMLMWTGIIAGTVLGFGFKENAALLPLYIATIEFIFYRHLWHSSVRRRRLLFIYAIPFAVLTLAALMWLIGRQTSLDSVYLLREFSLTERLLTEARVLWFYAGLIFIPQFHNFSLFHDDFAISTGLFSPWTTAPAVLGLIGAVFFATLMRRRAPILSFSIIWFLAGHSLESTFIGLELVHEHRNYIPSLGPITGIAYGLCALAAQTRFKQLTIGFCVGLIAVLALTTRTIAANWADEQTLAKYLLQYHPNSARAHVMLADFLYLSARDPLTAIDHYLTASDLAPHETAFLIRPVQIAFQTEVQKVDSKATDLTIGFRDRSGQAVIAFKRSAHGRLSLQPTSYLYETIGHRLSAQPVHARTAEALQELAKCVSSQTICQSALPQTIAWHKSAIENTRTTKIVRLQLLMQLVQLEIASGNLEDAQLFSKKALMLEPKNRTLILMDANVQLLANNVSNASALLHNLYQRPDLMSDDQRRNADILLSIIRSKQRN